MSPCVTVKAYMVAFDVRAVVVDIVRAVRCSERDAGGQSSREGERTVCEQRPRRDDSRSMRRFFLTSSHERNDRMAEFRSYNMRGVPVTMRIVCGENR